MSAGAETAETLAGLQGTDAEFIEAPRERRVLGLAASTWPRILAPLAIGLMVLGFWETMLRIHEVPIYILPGPLLIVQTLIKDWGTLSISLWVTCRSP